MSSKTQLENVGKCNIFLQEEKDETKKSVQMGVDRLSYWSKELKKLKFVVILHRTFFIHYLNKEKMKRWEIEFRLTFEVSCMNP